MFTGVSWGVSVSELLSGAVEFIMVFKEFLLLGAIVVFAPYIVSFFKGIIKKNQKAS